MTWSDKSTGRLQLRNRSGSAEEDATSSEENGRFTLNHVCIFTKQYCYTYLSYYTQTHTQYTHAVQVPAMVTNVGA